MTNAHRLSISTMALLIGLGASPVLAQTVNDNNTTTSTAAVMAPSTAAVATPDTLNSQATDRIVGRDLSEQQRIESGLTDGQLTTQEGASLERGEARIDQMESSDLSNGTLTTQEAAQLRRAENAENNRITRLEDNGNTTTAGTGSGTTNTQLEADVQRNINQQQRIDNGVANGSLTNTEAGHLEGGQASIAQAEASAGSDNMISASEQTAIRGDDKTQSADIKDDRHNDTTTTTVTGSMHDHDRDRDGGWGHWSWDRHNNDGNANNGTMVNANGNMTASTGGSTSVDSGSSTSVVNAGSTSVTPVSAPAAVMPPAPPAPVVHPHVAAVAHGK